MSEKSFIDVLCSQAHCKREEAIEAVRKHNGNVTMALVDLLWEDLVNGRIQPPMVQPRDKSPPPQN
jgi:hypothetical protein